MKLSREFFLRNDVALIARELLGKILYTSCNGNLTGGMITETEAYDGPWDKASHAYGNKRTHRTEVMFHEGGKAYIYLCYGLHHLFNVVTGKEGIPQAVLIRAVKPITGIEIMLQRRNLKQNMPAISNGPGKLSQALGITGKLNGVLLTEQRIWIEDLPQAVAPLEIVTSTRIGIDYAEEHVSLPFRFYLKNEKYISKP